MARLLDVEQENADEELPMALETSLPPELGDTRSPLPALLAQSWQRCQAAGLSSHSLPAGQASASQAYALRQQAGALLRAAAPLLATLASQLAASGSAVVLANADGVVVDRLGEPVLLDQLDALGLQLGADWREARCGTNAIGTALEADQALTVHGPEHYLAALRQLTCAATPLRLPCGRRAGVLGITGPCRHRQPHTLALVSLAAQGIEQRLLHQQAAGHWLLSVADADASSKAGAEYQLVFSAHGDWLAACAAARHQFAPDARVLPSWRFAQLFADDFASWTQRALHAPGQSHPLADHQGRLWRGHVRRVVTDDPLPPSLLSAAPSPGLPRTLMALTGGDPQLDSAARRALRIVGKDIPLLIEGETGTGKEVFAQAFHRSSPRRNGPFVALNCAAIPEGLIESELFGYEDGAFTGARRKGHVGRIAQANGGTLFLDEIGDMPLSLQAHLLRVLQEREVCPLGGRQAQPVDIAIVCATHRDLRQAVAEGRFREDLYYRLAGVRVRLPALRERSDRLALCQHLLAEENHGLPVSLSPALGRWLEQHPWPGNLRQLRSVLRSALASRDDPLEALDCCHLDEDFSMRMVPPSLLASHSQASRLADIEQHAMQHTLSACGGNISAAARQLGISRATLYRRLRA
jgi:transcriptional regulator of acetoin/glycerol metabolism